MKVDISVGVEMPDKLKNEYRQPTVCEKCRDFMTVCEADASSRYHWDYLRAIYKKLINMKNKPEHLRELTLELEDFLLKHDNVNHSDEEQPLLDHSTLERLK